MKFQSLTDNLLQELDHIKRSFPTILDQSLQCISLCRTLLAIFRREIVRKGFKSESEEINFFKSIKPVPQSQLIYHKTIYQFEVYSSGSTEIRLKKCIEEKLKSYEYFFLTNIDFGQYIQMEQTHFDQYYFTRKPIEKLPVLGFDNFDEDPEFCTPKDLTLAKFKAYGQLTLYLKRRLHSFPEGINLVNGEPLRLQWTGNKIDLVELIYALHTSGSIKEGTGIKEIAKACENLFNVDLGNYYRKFIELRNRKLVERTRFIDTLKSSLIQRMEEADD